LKIRWFVIIRRAFWRRSDSVLAGIRNHPALRAPLLEKEGSRGRGKGGEWGEQKSALDAGR